MAAMTPSAVLHSIYPKGELTEDGFALLMRDADKDTLLQAAIALNPKDARGHALIQRAKELK